MAFGDNRTERASDDFSGGIGGSWSNGEGDWFTFSASGGTVGPQNNNNDCAMRHSQTLTDDQYAIITAGAAQGSTGWLAARTRCASGTDESCYMAQITDPSTAETRVREVDGAFNFTSVSFVSNGGQSLGAGETIAGECEGTTIRTGIEGSEDTSGTDATITGGDGGVYGFETTNGHCDITDWAAGDIGAGGTIVPQMMQHRRIWPHLIR